MKSSGSPRSKAGPVVKASARAAQNVRNDDVTSEAMRVFVANAAIHSCLDMSSQSVLCLLYSTRAHNDTPINHPTRNPLTNTTRSFISSAAVCVTASAGGLVQQRVGGI